jgi:hypothetical protein
VATKCDSSDDEIVREYRETAEATPLKGPTSVNDHDASAVAVEDQHKTLKKTSESRRRENLRSYTESYECEPEKIIIICDPVEWIIPLNDSKRCSIVRMGPIRPELSDQYPKDEKADIFVPFTKIELKKWLQTEPCDGCSTQKLRTVITVSHAHYFQHYKSLLFLMDAVTGNF